MLGKGTRFSSDIYLDTFDSAVAHVRDREVDDTVSSEERESSDRTILFQTLYPDVIAGKINDS